MVVVGAITLRLLGRVSALERFFGRRRDRALVPQNSLAAPATLISVVLPALFWQVALVGEALFIMQRHWVGREALVPRIMLGATLLLPLGAFVWGLVCHWREPLARARKYTFFIAGSVMAWALVWIRWPDHTSNSSPDLAFNLRPLVLAPLVLIAVTLGIRQLVGAVAEPPTRWVRRLYRLVISLGHPLVVLTMMVVGWGLPVYLLLRFQVVRRMATRPILYFRSFRHPEAAQAFGFVVAPVARKFGVVTGLVHFRQPSTSIQAETNATDRAHFEDVSDESWRQWVESKLATCSAVVADVSQESESLAWEIEAAIRAVGAQRVAAIVNPKQQPDLHPRVMKIEYRDDWPSINEARWRLRDWLGGVFADGGQSSAAARPAATSEATSRTISSSRPPSVPVSPEERPPPWLAPDRPPTPAVVALLVTLGLPWTAYFAAPSLQGSLVHFLILFDPLWVWESGEVWRFVTTLWINGTASGLLVLAGVWFVGARLERDYGWWRFLLLFVLPGVAGTIVTAAAFLIDEENRSTLDDRQVFGAGAAVLGLFVAFARRQQGAPVWLLRSVIVEAPILAAVLVGLSVVWGAATQQWLWLAGELTTLLVAYLMAGALRRSP
jgi:hypothetical protein